MKKILAIAAAAMMAGSAGAMIIFQDDFSTSQGAGFTAGGAIGGSSWSVTRSGADWGARIHGGTLELSNDASAAANANGWAFAGQTMASSGNFNNVLQNSAGLVTWQWNMQQIRTDPAGFGATSYGLAFVLGATVNNPATSGTGYAVVLGNTGATDPVRFVQFTAGLRQLDTTPGGLIVATAPAPLNDVGAEHMSLRVTYDPSSHAWNMYGRNDGVGFADPGSGTLALLGSVVNSAHTAISLPNMGAYWQGSTAANQTAKIDNLTLTAIPEPGTLGLIGAGLGLAAILRRWRR